MTKKPGMNSAVLAAFLAGCAFSGLVLAVDEVELNNTYTSAQHLVIGADGTVTVNGVMGALSGTPVGDVDFYSFEGKNGDIVTIDIDGGANADGTGLDSILALFGPFNSTTGLQPYHMYGQSDDETVDPGSAFVYIDGFTGAQMSYDSRIGPIKLDQDGTYWVGVSSYLRFFADINTLQQGDVLSANSIGSYTLIISGVTPPPAPVAPPPKQEPQVININIEIKPGSNELSPVNPKAKGSIPVVLLSSAQFNAAQVDQASLTFGSTGSEASLVRCNPATDLNRDGRPDLLCHFDNQKAAFQRGDTEGIVKGTAAGKPFEGRGWLKVVPGKRQRQ